MLGLSTTYQIFNERREATLTAIPISTAEALEAVYQKGLAYINIGRWQEAKSQLDMVFELDPDYKQVQAKLREVESKIVEELSSTQQPTSTEVYKTSSDTGVVAYYPFSGNTKDESRNKNHGTVYGATLTADRFGNPNRAYNFDGVDDYIEIPHSDSLNPTNTMSLAAWIIVRQPEFYPAVISKGNVGNYQESYSLFLDPGNQLGFLLNKDSTSTGRDQLIRTTIPLNTWTHVAGTYDGVNMYTYVNGVQVGRTTHVGSIFTNSTPVLIGKSERQLSNYPTSFFNGSIDEVKIFNRFLSAEEVQTIFKESSTDR